MSTEYHLIIEWTGEKYIIHYGLPSAHGFDATVADEFALGEEKCIVWQVNCCLLPEEVQRVCRKALGLV